jgi:hypothetical protein
MQRFTHSLRQTYSDNFQLILSQLDIVVSIGLDKIRLLRPPDHSLRYHRQHLTAIVQNGGLSDIRR